MNVRTLSLLAAFAASAPLAAYADAPSGDFAAIFGPQTTVHASPDLARADNRTYVEGNFEQLFVRNQQLTVDQVRRTITAAPLPIIGA